MTGKCSGVLRWFFLLLPLQAAAQQREVISLKDLLLQVNGNAPSLQTGAAAVRIKTAQEEAARFNWLPSLKLNYQADLGTNNNLPGGYFSNGIVPGNSRVRNEANTQTILTDLGIAAFDWEIFNFGAYDAQRQAATAETAVEKARFSQSKYELQAYAINYYLQLLRLYNLQSIQQQNIERNMEIRRSIQSLAISGIKAGVDTSIAEAELSKSRLDLMTIQNQQKQLRLQLSAISGLAESRIMPDTALPDKMYNAFLGLNDLEQDSIAGGHPLMEVYRAMENSSKYKEVQIRKSYNPKVLLQAAAWGRGSSVSADDEFRALPKGFGFERSNYLVGIGVTFNIFDLKKRQLQLHTQKETTAFTRKQLDEQEVMLRTGEAQADAELQTARERLQEIPHQLDAARAAYRQKFSLYKNGLTNIVEVNAALTMLYRSETDYINARYAYCKAVFQKAYAVDQVAELLNILN